MSNKPRFGLFYISNGRWTGPYANVKFTKYTWTRNPVKTELATLKNRILKSRVKLRPVQA
jgi:hypothetical protein